MRLNALNPRHQIKVPVPVHNGHRMLTAERRNPQIIGRNRLANSFQRQADNCALERSLLINIKHVHRHNPLPKPVLVDRMMQGGLRDSESVFAEDMSGTSTRGARARTSSAAGSPSAATDKAFVSKINATSPDRFSQNPPQ
jgi:hypothetical protein